MITNTAADPNAVKRENIRKAAEQAEAREKVLVGNLLKTEEGRWLLGRLLTVFESGVNNTSTGHNSMDSYQRGKQDVARDQINLVIKHFGYAGIDTLLKGKS